MDADPKIESSNSGDSIERLLDHLSRQPELFARHQTRGDADMAPSDRLLLLRTQLDEDPSDFLARYHRHVPHDMVDSLQRLLALRRMRPHSNADAEPDLRTAYYLAAIRRSGRPAQRKNRRYQALQRLIAEGEYFSEDSMRNREPYLYHRYIGRYLQAAESAGAVGQGSSDRVMSHFLMRHCDRIEENARYNTAAAANAGCPGAEDSDEDMEEEEEDDAEYKLGVVGRGQQFLPERERHLLRAEFTSMMHRRFLAGDDAEYFDYAAVDNDDSLDVSEQYLRDVEESYFDSEEPS